MKCSKCGGKFALSDTAQNLLMISCKDCSNTFTIDTNVHPEFKEPVVRILYGIEED